MKRLLIDVVFGVTGVALIRTSVIPGLPWWAELCCLLGGFALIAAAIGPWGSGDAR